MEEGSLRGLAIVAAVGFFVPLLLGFVPRLRLPSVVLEIAVGAVIGPSVLGWVQVDEPIRIFSRLGFASLLFLAGLEIELDLLRGALLRLAAWGFLFSLLLSVVFCYALRAAGLLETPLLVAILLSATSVGLVIPVLKDAGEIASPFGQLVVVAISIADFGAILLLTLLFSTQSGSVSETFFLLATVSLLCVLIALATTGLGRWKRLSETLQRLQDTTAMIRIRGAAFLLIAFVVLVEEMGLEIILGAFAAGVLLGYLDRDSLRTHPQFQSRLQAVGFGIFIPVFFVTSGLQLDLQGLVTGGSTLAVVPVFFAGLLLVRGVPALLYVRLLGRRRAGVAGLLQATSLPFLVAGARIGVELGKMSQATAAALIMGGILSVLILPSAALSLLPEKSSD